MPTTVSVFSYTRSVTYVTDNILRSFKDIIRLVGLDPGDMDWEVLDRGIHTWIVSGHLERIVLEIYDPPTGELLGRWAVEVVYAYSGDDGTFWTDTEAIRYAIKKAGGHPASCRYDIKVRNAPGAQDVNGWSPTTMRSTAGFVEQRIGTMVGASGLSGAFSYYRRH